MERDYNDGRPITLTEELQNNKIIALMQKDIVDLKETSNRIETTLKEFIEAADKKYASKAESWAERVLSWFFIAVGAGVIGMVSYAIYHAYTSIV